jgi:hypothetical protein
VPSPVQYESTLTSDPATRAKPVLFGGPSELTPTHQEKVLHVDMGIFQNAMLGNLFMRKLSKV